MIPTVDNSEARREASWPHFIGLLVCQIWAAHAFVFFAHEYAHSFVAWLLGWKSNPLALNYGHFTFMVALIQLGIDQNVDEVAIFASGHGVQAALISAAGLVLGNFLLTLTLSRWGYAAAVKRSAPGWALLSYWMCVASIGNLIDYVPIRIFTDGTDLYQDMYAVELGLGWSPWTLLWVLGIPTSTTVIYFFVRIMPESLNWLFPRSAARRAVVAVLTALFLFGFYGAAGLLGGGPVSHSMSLISVCIVAPIIAVASALATVRNRPTRPCGPQ